MYIYNDPPPDLTEQKGDLSQEVNQELSKCNLGKVLIKTEINYSPNVATNDYTTKSIYGSIIKVIYNYLYKNFGLFQKIADVYDTEKIIGRRDYLIINARFKLIKTKIDGDASHLSSCIGNIVDFFSKPGKIYFFTITMNTSEKWGIICIKDNTSIMGPEFRRDKSLDLIFNLLKNILFMKKINKMQYYHQLLSDYV